MLNKIDDDFKLSNITNTANTFTGTFIPSNNLSMNEVLEDETNYVNASFCKYVIKQVTDLKDPELEILETDMFLSVAGTFVIKNKETNEIAYIYRILPKEYTTYDDKTLNIPDKPYINPLVKIAKMQDENNNTLALGLIFKYVDGLDYDEYIAQHPEDKTLINDKIINVLLDLKNTKIKPDEVINASYTTGAELFATRQKLVNQAIISFDKSIKKFLSPKYKLKDNPKAKRWIDCYNNLTKPDTTNLPYHLNLNLNKNVIVTNTKDVIIQAPRMFSYDSIGNDFIDGLLDYDFVPEQITNYINHCTHDELLNLHADLYCKLLALLEEYFGYLIDVNNGTYLKIFNRIYHPIPMLTKLRQAVNLVDTHLKQTSQSKQTKVPKTKK